MAAQDHGCRAEKKVAPILRNTFPIAQEYATRPIHAGFGGMGRDLPQELLPQRRIVAGGFLIQNNQIRSKATPSPIGLRQQQFANQREMTIIAHGDREHWEVAGDSELPQARLPQPVAHQSVALRSQPRVGIKQMAGEFLETMRSERSDTQIPELQLRARPGKLERPPR